MSHSYKSCVTLETVKEALNRISPYVHQTPVLTCSTLDEIATTNSGSKNQLKLHFKCENLQKTGAFKARGACNAILLAKSKGVNGIVTHSSGNHGQAVAWASSTQVANLPCTVVVPKGTPQIKCDAITGYGAELIFCDNSSPDIVLLQLSMKLLSKNSIQTPLQLMCVQACVARIRF